MSNNPVGRQIRKRNIVIVDDDSSVVMGIARRIMRQIDIIPAVSAESALELMSTQSHIDLVATDLEMPGMDGVEFLEEVKRRHPEAKRILFTGHINATKVVKAIRDLDVIAMLYKPIDPMELLEYARGTHPSITGFESNYEDTWR